MYIVKNNTGVTLTYSGGNVWPGEERTFVPSSFDSKLFKSEIGEFEITSNFGTHTSKCKGHISCDPVVVKDGGTFVVGY